MDVIDGEVVRVTPAAVLVKHGGKETWVPRSVCAGGDELGEGDTDIQVERWFAEKEGLS